MVAHFPTPLSFITSLRYSDAFTDPYWLTSVINQISCSSFSQRIAESCCLDISSIPSPNRMNAKDNVGYLLVSEHRCVLHSSCCTIERNHARSHRRSR